MLDILLVGAEVVVEGCLIKANIGIMNGIIAAIVNPEVTLDAKQTINLTGALVIPGVIETHLHADHSMGWDETFEEASISAAYGGVTTIMPFLWGGPGENINEYLGRLIDKLQKTSFVDFAPHCGLRPEMDAIKQIPKAFEMGVSSFKMHMDYRKQGGGRMSDDDHRLMAMELIGKQKGVATFHAENGYVVDYTENKLIAEGNTGIQFLHKSRPKLAEAEAVYRSIVLGTLAECDVYIVHLSTPEALEEITRARNKGKRVYCETCPQYLLLTNEELNRQGELAMVGPPLREKEDLAAMWWGVQTGFIQTIGSDHASRTVKAKTRKVDAFFEVPLGMPGTETMLPLIYSEGVVKGKISIIRMVQALCEEPAKIFSLYPKKGVIKVGSDADLVAIDPAAEWKIKADSLHAKAGYTCFEGWQVKGRPVLSLLRGQLLLKDGKLLQKPGFGRLVKRPI